MSDLLKPQIGLGTSTALVVGEVVAIGIFLTPAGMAKSVASPMWTLIIWLAMGAMALCGALCYGELASRYPEAGGGYVYLREAYGRPIAFLYGWMSLLVMDCGITAALAVGLASYAGYLFGLSATALKMTAVGSIVALASLNILGARPSARLIRGLTLSKLIALVVIVLWAAASRSGSFSNFVPFVARRAGSGPFLPALAGGMMSAFFSFGGWWDLSKLAGEVRDPARTLPRALAYGVAIVTAIYVITSATFLYLVPLEAVTSGETFAAQAGEVLFGPLGGQILSGIVMIAVTGSLASLLLASPRVYFAMARDGLFFPAVASLDPRFGTPARAIAIQATLASLLAMLGTFNEIIAYFLFVAVLFITLTVAALFPLRRRDVAGSYRTPGYPLTPIAFLILATVLLTMLASGNPRQSLLGLLVVATGLPVYWFFVRGQAEPALRKAGSSP